MAFGSAFPAKSSRSSAESWASSGDSAPAWGVRAGSTGRVTWDAGVAVSPGAAGAAWGAAAWAATGSGAASAGEAQQ